MYLAAHDVKDPTRKRALLLYSAGEEVSGIFETLLDQGEEREYEKTVPALNAYFQPKVNKLQRPTRLTCSEMVLRIQASPLTLTA